MRNSKILKAILFFLGLFLIAVGFGRLLMPVEVYSNLGLALGSDISMLSEARGVGGLMFGLGMLIMLGAFKPSLAFTSSVLSFLVFLSFGFSRLVGIATDGTPNPQILQGIIFEFAFGLIALIAFLKYRSKKS
jgi:hypothetical protein